MAKHYIRLDSNNLIIKGFSDEFEQSLQSDICVNEDGGRHFELNNVVNPSLINDKNIYLYKYENGEVLLRTNDEINLDELALPKPPISLEEKIALLQKAMDDLLLGGV